MQIFTRILDNKNYAVKTITTPDAKEIKDKMKEIELNLKVKNNECFV